MDGRMKDKKLGVISILVDRDIFEKYSNLMQIKPDSQ
jgi:hypothetical protein